MTKTLGSTEAIWRDFIGWNPDSQVDEWLDAVVSHLTCQGAIARPLFSAKRDRISYRLL
jgi:hypothetical protein